MQKQQPDIINPALLWEYDLTTFNYEKSYKIVIERVLQRGNLDEWRETPLLANRCWLKFLISLYIFLK